MPVAAIFIIDQLFYALDFFTAGPRLQITVLADDPIQTEGGLRFEVENVGNRPTCLHPVVRAAFITAAGERRNMLFDVQDTDLALPPFTPKTFQATARQAQPERQGVARQYCFDHGDGAAIEIQVD
jgi:hypothetical protein